MTPNFHNIKVQGEAASVAVSAYSKFPEMLKIIIEEGGLLPDQIFHVNEDAL